MWRPPASLKDTSLQGMLFFVFFYSAVVRHQAQPVPQWLLTRKPSRPMGVCHCVKTRCLMIKMLTEGFGIYMFHNGYPLQLRTLTKGILLKLRFPQNCY